MCYNACNRPEPRHVTRATICVTTRATACANGRIIKWDEVDFKVHIFQYIFEVT